MAKNLVKKVFSSNANWVCPAGVNSVRISAPRENVKSLVSGGFATFFLDSLGNAYASGFDNGQGTMGDNAGITRSSPVLVVGSKTWLQLGAGSSHAYGIDSNGLAYAWGTGATGRTGLGDDVNRSSPTLVAGPSTRKYHTIGMSYASNIQLIDLAGNLYIAGNNTSGQIGDNTVDPKSSPTLVLGSKNWSQVTGGSQFSAGLDVNGDAYCWGLGTNGLLGDNTTTSKSSPVLVVGGHKFIQIASNNSSTFALKANGQVWAWGLNSSGELGDNTTQNRSSPVLVVGGRTFVSISGGAGLEASGDLYCWGLNTEGAVGDNSTANRSSPVLVVGGLKFVKSCSGNSSGGTSHIAMTVGGDLYSWGTNANGQLGQNTSTNRSSPVLVVGGRIGLAAIQTRLNSITIPVTPGATYAVIVSASFASFAGYSLAPSFGSTKLILEYQA